MKKIRPTRFEALSFAEASCTSQERFAIGQLVRSKTGKDMGTYYLVIALGKDRLLVSDGRARPLGHPKVKNRIHLQALGKVAADLAERPLVKGYLNATDEEIRAVLNRHLSESDNLYKEGENNVQTRRNRS